MATLEKFVRDANLNIFWSFQKIQIISNKKLFTDLKKNNLTIFSDFFKYLSFSSKITKPKILKSKNL